jgi:hypothetical protein
LESKACIKNGSIRNVTNRLIDIEVPSHRECDTVLDYLLILFLFLVGDIFNMTGKKCNIKTRFLNKKKNVQENLEMAGGESSQQQPQWT